MIASEVPPLGWRRAALVALTAVLARNEALAALPTAALKVDAPVTLEMDCQEVGIGPAYIDSAYNQILVSTLVVDLLGYPPRDAAARFARAQFEMSIVSPPRRGSLRVSSDGSNVGYEAPVAAREGFDAFSVQAKATDAKGHRRTYLLKYTVAVVQGITNEALPSACERWAVPTIVQPPPKPASVQRADSPALRQGH